MTELERAERSANRNGAAKLASRGKKYEKARARRHRRRRASAFVAVLCAALAVVAAAEHLANAGKIRAGVQVGNVSLGGMTPEEARETLEERVGQLEGVRLDGPVDAAMIAEEIALSYDVAATVERAYAVGRRGGVAERLGERVRAAFGTMRVVPEAEYRSGAVRAEVRGLAAESNRDARPASVEVAAGEVVVSEARAGYALDAPATEREVHEAVRNLSAEARVVGETLEPAVSTPAAERAARNARRALSGPVVLTSEDAEWTLDPRRVGRSIEFTPQDGRLRAGLDGEEFVASLADVRARIEEEPVEAGFVVDGGEVSVTPGRAGKSVAEDELREAVEAGIFEGRREYRVPVVAVEPDLTTAGAERLKPTELLGTYRTNYTISGDSSAERVENLEIASGAVSGTTLAPGEVFSFNELAAPLEYNEAKVIVDGQVAYEDGGGLCQVSSTLYMAANYAGLDVTERHPHYAELPYIRPGFDATVWFGSLDMKFRNTTDGYVLIRETVAPDGYVYAEIWGRPTGTEVSMSSRRVSADDASTSWVTYQEVTENGEVLFDGVLHRDTYEPLTSETGEPIPNAAPAPANP